ncbi:crotonobetaine/carnitine-CoA ligase [Novosphingobium hassiacum]|uniref:Crotonobetaine/carnitine-CoA ligase n=1 Tax=Novosphingobium hassiacum TaxID=173676 RepID=A0A7W5ZX84_9SPHN|nr:AMP-binding protein [Novosphingobium hassiacum]MBB3860919.1 crotonobetaine/carnitine-CoA ligase [Novosphingobium hassiacum]
MGEWEAGRDETITGLFAQAAAEMGDKPYLDFKGDLYSYADIDRLSDALARGLATLGVKPGDTVASILDNNVDAVLCWFAVNKLGAISVPVNTAYKGEFLRHQIADAGANVIVTEHDYADRVLDLADQLPNLSTLLHRGDELLKSHTSLGIHLLETMKIDGDDRSMMVQNKPSDLAMLIYTSGTTGPSKGCMISHGYACNLARQVLTALGIRSTDVMWSALPLFHMNATAGTVLSVAIARARAAFYTRFSLSNFWYDVERSGATVLSLLGSMHPLIAEAPDNEASQRCFGQVRVVCAAPFPKDLQEKWRTRFGTSVMGAPGYGFTEAAMMVYGPLETRLDFNSSGPRAEEFDVEIVDENDDPLPVGERGEIVCRPKRPNVMFSGYWNRPAETLKIMNNLWLHTGDIGMFGENGEFYFLDRKKDYLRRRGENISSFEMEATFQNHPDIMDVAVHAVFSPMGEDDVKVTAVLRDGSQLTAEDLCTWCLDKVPFFAVPRYIEFRRDKDMPRNPTGKILKYQLRDDGCTPTTWDREKEKFEIARR